MKRVNKKDVTNPNSLSNNFLNSEVNIHKKEYYKKYKKKEDIKQKVNNINKLSMKEIFLPFKINCIEKTEEIKKVRYKTESNINIKNNIIGTNINNVKNLSRTNDILFTLPNVSNKLINNISYDKIWKNNSKDNKNFTSTSPPTYRHFFSQYKKGKTKNFIPKDDFNNFKCCFTNVNFSNNINDAKITNFDIKTREIFPNVKKMSLRNVVFDENYREKEIQKYIFSNNEINNKEKEENKNFNLNLKKYDRLAVFVKYKNNNKNNNIKEENTSNNNRCDTFNKISDSSRNYNDKSLNNRDKNYSSNNIKEMKGLFSIKKYDNYKGSKIINSNSNKKSNTLYNKNKEIIKYNKYIDYLNEKYIPKRKGNKNDDILSILNIDN